MWAPFFEGVSRLLVLVLRNIVVRREARLQIQPADYRASYGTEGRMRLGTLHARSLEHTSLACWLFDNRRGNRRQTLRVVFLASQDQDLPQFFALLTPE